VQTYSTSPIQLEEIHSRSVEVRGPFNPRTTLHKPSHFPSPFDVVGDNSYSFMTNVSGHLVGGRAAFEEHEPVVDLQILLPSDQTELDLDAASTEIARRLGLDLELQNYEDMWRGDSILAGLPRELCGARPSSPFSLYELLVICTVLQNTTIRRTVQMITTLAAQLGRRCSFPSGEQLSSFWPPSSVVGLGEPALRDLKLGYRAKTLARAAEHFIGAPGVEERLLQVPSDSLGLRRELSAIYGVGPASVGYIMFEWFKLPNEFSHVSPWELKILSKLLFDRMDVPPAELIEFAHERWDPYTMVAVHAIFESIFWRRHRGYGPAWLDELIRL